ncbi:hypothetical protein G7Z17_g1774 [Cylindrodendrum hubeiense]|uniref:Ankyrin n=1 Tax=Cylindrodendrum hubeiense TaxID=595255 RepID=A0A9P5LC73_9HYPO|nr:hypothetical protein G7Z17_g1774 [Cylindrodendrum hubeiense]
MASGADINMKDGEGQTPIALLFWPGWVRSVYKPLRTLIDAGADIDTIDQNGDGLLMRTLKSTRDVGALQRLFRADQNRPDGKSPQWDRQYCQTKPFLGAFWYNTNGPDGQEEVLDYLLAQGATVEDGGEAVQVMKGILRHGQPDALAKVLATREDSSFLNELLHEAGSTLNGRERVASFIRIILHSGGSIDAADGEGITPLMRAAISKDVAAAFIKLGADCTLKDSLGRTVIHHLMNYWTWPKSVSRWLRSLTLHPPVLDCLSVFIAAGCDTNATTRDGRTPLDYAMKLFADVNSNEDDMAFAEIDIRKHWLVLTIERLLERCEPQQQFTSAALHSFLDDSARPLHNQLQQPQVYLPHIIEMLKDADPDFDINSENVEGLVPIHVAASTITDQGLPCMDTLQIYGAQLDIKTTHGRNILHIACRARNPSTVSYLCSQAPWAISQADNNGRTPLFEACLVGCPETVVLLVQHGAAIDVVDIEGLTPFHICVEGLSHHDLRVADDLGSHSERSDTLGSPQNPEKDERCQVRNPLHSVQSIMRAMIEKATELEMPNLHEIAQSVVQYAGTHLSTYVQPLIDFLKEHTESTSSIPDGFSHLTHDQAPSFRYNMPSPDKFLACCSLSDIRALRTHDPKTLKFRDMDTQETPHGAVNPDYKVWSRLFLRCITDAGLTEVLIALTDERTSETGFTSRSLRIFNESLESWELESMMERACESRSPNLAMLRTLVRNFAVDVNMKVLKYIEDAPLIHSLVKGQAHWHLEAIQFIVANGADLEGTNNENQTALHIACKQDQPWSGKIATLLLQLGADPEAKDEQGKSALRGVCSKTVIKALQENEVAMHDIASMEDLLLAIGRLDVDGVEIAIQSGLDIDLLIDDPVWTEDEYDPELGGSSIHNGWEATPLLGALQFYEYGQKSWTKAHHDTREAILRLLIEEDPNLLQLLQFRHLDVYEEVVVERVQPPYEYCQEHGVDEELDTMPFLHGVFKYVRSSRRHLGVFFEYPDKIRAVVNARGGNRDETLFLAACNAKLDCPINNVEHEEDMMDLGADVLATDREGNNALHILLKNPCTQGRHIVQFLSCPETYPLINDKDPTGWSCLQLALKILRPEVVLKLLSLEPEFETDMLLHDPEGYTALHRIATQILHEHVPVLPEERNIGQRLLQPIVRKCYSNQDYEASSVVRYLVEKLRLDPLVEDKDGLTVIDLAAKKRLRRVKAVFVDKK